MVCRRLSWISGEWCLLSPKYAMRAQASVLWEGLQFFIFGGDRKTLTPGRLGKFRNTLCSVILTSFWQLSISCGGFQEAFSLGLHGESREAIQALYVSQYSVVWRCEVGVWDMVLHVLFTRNGSEHLLQSLKANGSHFKTEFL